MIVDLYTGYDKRELLVALAENGHIIRNIVIPKDDKYRDELQDFLRYLSDTGLEVIDFDKQGIERLDRQDCGGVLLLSAGFPRILSPTHYRLYDYAINIHPTLLPRHRGKYQNYVILDGDSQSGLTAHLIDEGVDTGPILKSVQFDLSPFETIRSLKRRSIELEPIFVVDVLSDLEDLARTATAQDERQATTHLNQRVPGDSELDPSLPLIDLLPIIRAADPDLYPAHFWHNGKRIRVTTCRDDKPREEWDMV
jgi:methionyl-tRNA formyltransferase